MECVCVCVGVDRWVCVGVYLCQWRRKYMKSGEAMNGVYCAALTNACKRKQNGT